MTLQPALTPRYALALCAIYGQQPSRAAGLFLLDAPGQVRLVRHPRLAPGLTGAEPMPQGDDLVLGVSDEFMSGQHAILRRDPGGRFRVEDAGSKNGTRLDGVPLLHGSRPLRHGDLIETGRSLFCFLELPDGLGADDERDRVLSQAPRLLHPFWPSTLNPPLRRVFGVLSRLNDTGVPVLINGEPGTGKRWLSHYLHERYSGAGQLRVIGPADKLPPLRELQVQVDGTLLVEDVGRLGPEDQHELLQFMQHAAAQGRPRGFGLRVIATSDVDLAVLASGGAFRADLLRQLSSVVLALPALRERKEDIGLLSEFFLTQQQGGDSTFRMPEMAPETWRRLFSYDWPGNQTELRAALRHAAHAARVRDKGPVLLIDLPESVQRGQSGLHVAQMSVQSVPPAWLPVAPRTPHRLPEHEVALPAITPSQGHGVGAVGDRDARRRALEAALEAESGKVARAARRLGISRVHMHRLAKQLGVNPDDYRSRKGAPGAGTDEDD